VADQMLIDKLRRQLGDTSGTTQFFTDPRLAALLVDAGNDLDRALLAGLHELRAEASKQVDFTIGPDSERAGQLFDHLTILSAEVTERIAAGGQVSSAGRIGTIAVPVRVAF